MPHNELHPRKTPCYWVLPPTWALWLPAGVVHRTGATREAVLCSLYLDPAACSPDWSEPTAVGVGALLAQLITYLARQDLAEDARQRAEALVPDLLHPVPTLPIDVPHPVDERVRAVADTLLADPADPRSLEAHAHDIGVSRRTLTRLFVRDTGMSFDRWRTHMRCAPPCLSWPKAVPSPRPPTPWDTRLRALSSRRSAGPWGPHPDDTSTRAPGSACESNGPMEAHRTSQRPLTVRESWADTTTNLNREACWTCVVDGAALPGAVRWHGYRSGPWQFRAGTTRGRGATSSASGGLLRRSGRSVLRALRRSPRVTVATERRAWIP